MNDIQHPIVQEFVCMLRRRFPDLLVNTFDYGMTVAVGRTPPKGKEAKMLYLSQAFREERDGVIGGWFVPLSKFNHIAKKLK